MFAILFRVEVKPDECQGFIEFIEKDIAVAKEKEQGTLRFELYQDPNDENAFVVYEEYRDEAAFEEHKNNQPYQEWQSRIMPAMVIDFRQFKSKRSLLKLSGR